ncbi:MAG: amidohydrolase, partial [Methanothrix sp.]|nr:amidohydrolase [Methanothrix sp.]
MLIRDVSLLQDGQLLKGRDILIDGSRIANVGCDLSAERGEDVIDGRGKLAIPGLVNAHTHLAMTLFRGYADDMALMPWLQEKIWPLEARLTREDIHWGVKLGCLELIRFGITCYNDMYYFMDETARATREMGLRAFLSGVVFESHPEFKGDAERFIADWRGDELIHPMVGPHAIYTCSEETLLWAKETAERAGIKIHIHLSETRDEVEASVREHGRSPVEYLDSMGFLGENVVAAHCVWLSERDVTLLARHGVNVVHCPISNLKLAAGVAPLERLISSGVNVCLGTDGAASNNNLTLFD